MMLKSTQNQIKNALSLLTPKSLVGVTKIRIGGELDGGYVMANRLHPTGGNAYSFGVGPDSSWDVAMAEFGWSVYQYDHTVDSAPSRHPLCHFHKIGLSDVDDKADLVRLDTLLRMEESYQRDDHILKIDIEGNEWACLGAMPMGFFQYFDQIVCELHWLDQLDNQEFLGHYLKFIGNMSLFHQCIHVHANNYAEIVNVQGIPISPVVEITFVKKSIFDFETNKELFPTALDRANDPSRPDHFLSTFRFV